jgi:hypothetical protein
MIAQSSVYDEISAFIAGINPKKVIAFKPSSNNQERLDTLLDKQKDTGLTVEEKTELEHYLIINRIIGLAKAQALKLVKSL